MRYNSQNQFLTVEEVSDLLRLSVLTIYKYIREMKLPAVVFGGHYRIERVSLEAFINEHKVVKPLPMKGLRLGEPLARRGEK